MLSIIREAFTTARDKYNDEKRKFLRDNLKQELRSPLLSQLIRDKYETELEKEI